MEKVVILTGGSSGIGRATTQLLREQGCTVYEFSRRPAPEDPFHMCVDVTDGAAVKAATDAVFEREGRIWLNVKCRADWAQVLCASYESVVPAYHMNKRHWVSVILDGKMEDAEVVRLIEESYDLTGKK